MFPESLETDSLDLVQLCRSNVDEFALYELFGAGRAGVEEVFEYVPQQPDSSVKEVHDQLVEAETAWDDRDGAQYAVYTANGEFAGYTGLFLEWERRSGRIGFILGQPYWGNGYAGECATALTELAFDQLELDADRRRDPRPPSLHRYSRTVPA